MRTLRDIEYAHGPVTTAAEPAPAAAGAAPATRGAKPTATPGTVPSRRPNAARTGRRRCTKSRDVEACAACSVVAAKTTTAAS